MYMLFAILLRVSRTDWLNFMSYLYLRARSTPGSGMAKKGCLIPPQANGSRSHRGKRSYHTYMYPTDIALWIGNKMETRLLVVTPRNSFLRF